MEKKTNNRLFENRKVIGHMELGSLYLPHIAPKSASRQLTRWIEQDPDLLDDLRQKGYRKGQRMYLPAQVAVLFDHLGDPDSRDVK